MNWRKGRALHIATGEAVIMEAVRDQLPAFVRLRSDVGLTRLAPGFQRVEVLFKTLFRGLSGVDGAAKGLLLVHTDRPAAATTAFDAARRVRRDAGYVCDALFSALRPKFQGKLAQQANRPWLQAAKCQLLQPVGDAEPEQSGSEFGGGPLR